MKTCTWGGDTFIGLLSQLVTAAPWHPSCVLPPLCCLWCSQDRPDSGFRVCCEEMGHRREGAAAWALILGHRSLRSCLSQLLSQAMNRHLKTPRNSWSQEQKGSVLFPSRPFTSLHASCIFQGSTWWDVSRNFP